MKFAELRERVYASLPFPEYAVSWFKSGLVTDQDYCVVPLPDGTFTIYRPSGRGEYLDEVDSSGSPVRFPDEDAVCDYVWEALESSRGSRTTPTSSLSPEQLAENVARARKKLLDALDSQS